MKVAILCMTLIWGLAVPGAEDECLDCHESKQISSLEIKKLKQDLDPEAWPINLTLFEGSIHADLECMDCHVDADMDHEDEGLEPVNCSECHEEAQEHFNMGIHSRSKLPDGSGVTCSSCHGTHDILESKNPQSRTFATRIPETCITCHQGDSKRDASQFYDSVHYKALTEAGLIVSANCVSCHDSHDIRRRNDLDSPVNRFKVGETCSKCHEGAFEDWKASAHGQAFLDGDLDAPVCTNCHGEHGIRSRIDPLSNVNPLNVSEVTCTPCHGSQTIYSNEGFQTGQTSTYEDSFHGLAARFGDPTVANCASCHGSHLILSSQDPVSSIHPDNLPDTCGACHPGAGVNFTLGSIHSPTESEGGQWLVMVRYIYIILITMTLAIMIGHNLLDYLKKLRDYHRKMVKGWKHERFTRFERLQHILLVLSFFILVITGFALKYPDSFWVQPLVDFKLGFLVRSYGHRIAAIVFMVLSAIHLLWLFFSRRGRSQMFAMLPTFKDAKDMLHQIRYYFDLEKHPGPFGRYSYIEKMEYLALVWGSIIMVVTGLILWFEESALLILPKWGWDLSELIHLYEAWLATLSIIAWHLYHVLFKPGAHEFTMAMVTGQLGEEAMQHEHSEEYKSLRLEEIKAKQEETVPGMPQVDGKGGVS